MTDLGAAVFGGLTDELMQKLTPLCQTQLSAGLEPCLAESVSASLEEAVPRDLSYYVSNAVSKDLQKRLTAVLTKSITDAVNGKAQDTVPEILALEMLRPMVHTLSRSITHSVVPAVVHTISHSAAMDIICAECSDNGNWCNYCHYSPTAYVYSVYYAGLFSTHYSDYYGDYYWNYFAGVFHPLYLDTDARKTLSLDMKDPTKVKHPRASDDSTQSVKNSLVPPDS
jgi:hypothetical protein